MNDIILNILERRSIRQYEDKAVSKETMAEILNAGAWAPSAMNRQTWRLTGIIDPEKVQKLAAVRKKSAGSAPVGGLFPFTTRPPLLLPAIPGVTRTAWRTAPALWKYDAGGHSMGLGTVWINQLKDTCGDAGVRKLLTAFG